MRYKTIYSFILFADISLLGSACKMQDEKYVMNETQLTYGKYGHTLNSTQVFSPDDQWIFYDTRNDDTHISRTGSIEKVNVQTGEVVNVYTTRNQTVFGPGVGAVACHPHIDKIIFIHGLLNCSEQQPYGFARRFGAIINSKNVLVHAEARVIKEPLVPGSLRGGTHAHTWSGDGDWISFTYNDYLMESLEKSSNGEVKDLRTIGVMAPLQKVNVPNEDAENFSGEYFTVVAATVTETPHAGSDEIERSFDECWIGKDGYMKVDGTKQKRAIAFQGNIRDSNDSIITEVFVADISEDIQHAAGNKPLEGTKNTRPNVPSGLAQRRLTFTVDRKYPGIQGPRCRLRTSPDGREIYFPMKDDAGIVQIFSVPALGGEIRQITLLDHSVQSQFNVSPDGKQLTVVADNSIWIIGTSNGKAIRITKKSNDEDAPVGGVLWSHSGEVLAFNRYVLTEGERYLQIFRMNLR